MRARVPAGSDFRRRIQLRGPSGLETHSEEHFRTLQILETEDPGSLAESNLESRGR